MIQSGKFDSSSMNIKNITNLVLNFIIKRLIEISGVFVSIIGILLLISLISYSPEDPNFIVPQNTEIKNLLGFQGSYLSDFFFQSIGFISFLIPLTYIFTGINIFKKKEILLFINNTFVIVIYSLIGSIFLSYFYSDVYSLYMNGNGGFIGNYLNEIYFQNIIKKNENIFFYFSIFLIVLFFLISINFDIQTFSFKIKKLFNFLIKSKTSNYTNKNEIINEYIPQDEIKDLIQKDLPFIKAEENRTTVDIKFKLPPIDLLETPIKNEKNKYENNDDSNPEFLEKILLDFGVNGKIKKISHGPVVTLNEFEPAAGVKVSKIINLSDDIARNTGSESARISTIPGSKTVGIEIPNLYFVDGDSAQAALQSAPGAAAATVELYPSGETTGQKLSGEMIVTSFEISAANDGAVTAEVSGQITGALTVTNL